jgi:hypothetical protein
MKTVLVFSYTDLSRDPRVNRQIRFLRSSYRVVAAGIADCMIEGVEYVPLDLQPMNFLKKSLFASRLLGRLYERVYWSQQRAQEALRKLRGIGADLVLCNDIETLPVAIRIAGGAKVMFDAHEYAPLEYEDNLLFRVFLQEYRKYLCRRYIPRVDCMTTVCEPIASRYRFDTGVSPAIITNAPDYEDLEPIALKADADRIRLVHHGGAMKARKLDKTLEVMEHLGDRYELSLLLISMKDGYLEHLKERADGRENIRFLPPVPMRELPGSLNRFDIGLFLLEPSNFNYRFALPNKLFEFIQARLAVAIGPSSEMARVVRECGCGVVAEDFAPHSVARAIESMTLEDINECKRRSHSVAGRFSSETNRVRLLELVGKLVGS